MNRNSAAELARELLFAFVLVTIAELVVLSTSWSRFWVLVAVFTTGNALRWWLRRQRTSSAEEAERGQTTSPPV